MARTLIRNVSGAPASLPLPYSGVLAPGTGVITGDSLTTVAGYLGSAIGAVFQIQSVAESNPVTVQTPTGLISSTDLAAGAVSDSTKIASGAVDATDLASGAVSDTTKIAANAVEEADIKNGAVTENKIGALAVTEGKIGALAVTAGKIGALAVEEAKINGLAVTEGKIGALAVTEGKIGALAVTAGKIGAAAVTTAKVAVAEATGATSEIASKIVIRKAFTDGGTTNPDDVIIYNPAATPTPLPPPFAFRVLDIQVLISGGNAGGRTATLRNALAGAGAALSDDLDCATTGRKRDAGTVTATATIAITDALVLRRSHDAIAGEVIIEIQKV